MSLAHDLTQCQARLADAGMQASAAARRLKGVAPVPVMSELMLQLCIVASEVNKMKALLGTLRMTGEMEQMPPSVTAERLELAQRERMLASLHRAGDHSLDDEDDHADVTDGSAVCGKEAA